MRFCSQFLSYGRNWLRNRLWQSTVRRQRRVLTLYKNEYNARCHQGTQLELLQQINICPGDRGSEYLPWLTDTADTGKSAISCTVAHNFVNKVDLSANFFNKRSEDGGGHAEASLATAAAQLVQDRPSLAPCVLNSNVANTLQESSKAMIWNGGLLKRAMDINHMFSQLL